MLPENETPRNTPPAAIQRERLSLAIVDAEMGNREPLQVLLATESQSRRERGIKEWRKYKLWRRDEQAAVAGVRSPKGHLYERIEKHELGTRADGLKGDMLHWVRFEGCPDQTYCDEVNEACKRFGLQGRLTTKHNAIFAHLVAELTGETIRWELTESGWLTTDVPPPASPMSDADFEVEPITPKRKRRTPPTGPGDNWDYDRDEGIF